MIAALYVATGGCYYGLPDVDPWDRTRDARAYAGPWPVVAHPPCERWGAYWSGGPSAPNRKQLGDDGGCFIAAISAVRKWGGVLEHPANSRAWHRCGLMLPPCDGGWVSAGMHDPGWTCCVEQGHYGHRARKATWLYAAHVQLPSLRWGPSVRKAFTGLPHYAHTPGKGLRAELRAARRAELRRISEETGKVWACPEMMSKTERAATPLPFRDLLISIARTAEQSCEQKGMDTHG